MKNNLKDNLNEIELVSNAYEYYDYIKIETICLIKYCSEYLVLYAKEVDDGILITDLNGTFEDALLNGITPEQLEAAANSCGLGFDGESVFVKTTLENLNKAIESFFKLINMLEI